MKVIDGDFGKKKDTREEVPTSEFLSVFVGKAMAHEQDGRHVKCCLLYTSDAADE